MAKILLFPVRASVFLVGFIAYWMEVAADWLVGARSRTEYVREGKCKRCGRCCGCLSLLMPDGVKRRDLLVRFCIWWHGVAMNFRYVAEEEGWLIYSCGYYKKGKGCSIYPFRHRLCRFFPRQKVYGHPSVHEDCGFRFVRRDVIERRERERGSGKRAFEDLLISGPSRRQGSE
ncbi:MAG TPA: hypothetical protein PLY45_01645 [bacterium]|nr:hypothetical protein [bacterium]